MKKSTPTPRERGADLPRADDRQPGHLHPAGVLDDDARTGAGLDRRPALPPGDAHGRLGGAGVLGTEQEGAGEDRPSAQAHLVAGVEVEGADRVQRPQGGRRRRPVVGVVTRRVDVADDTGRRRGVVGGVVGRGLAGRGFGVRTLGPAFVRAVATASAAGTARAAARSPAARSAVESGRSATAPAEAGAAARPVRTSAATVRPTPARRQLRPPGALDADGCDGSCMRTPPGRRVLLPSTPRDHGLDGCCEGVRVTCRGATG